MSVPIPHRLSSTASQLDRVGALLLVHYLHVPSQTFHDDELGATVGFVHRIPLTVLDVKLQR